MGAIREGQINGVPADTRRDYMSQEATRGDVTNSVTLENEAAGPCPLIRREHIRREYIPWQPVVSRSRELGRPDPRGSLCSRIACADDRTNSTT
jgi:hypothetical protein